jgi:hypothetical protein
MLPELITVLGLLSTFRQERANEKSLDHQQFMDWLTYHHHEELKNLIVSTHFLTREIDIFLRRDQEEILGQIKSLNELYASLLSRLNGFAGIVEATTPGIQISDQARDILVDFAAADAKFIYPRERMGVTILFLMGTNQNITPGEPRFVEDDLHSLVQLGFLAEDTTSDGTAIFKLTRNGSKYAAIIKTEGAKQNTAIPARPNPQ